MTANDKKDIYNLLKTASDWTFGYSSPLFKEAEPEFFDDIEKTSEEPAQAQAPLPSSSKVNQIQEENKPQETQEPQKKQGITLESIYAKIAHCQNCILSKSRKNTVSGTGVQNPLVLVINEGPNETEDNTGLCVEGKAGELLDKMLVSISLDKTTNCHITNIVKCRPPMNRSPMPDEISACKGYLEAQIHLLKPKMILCMGRTSLQGILNTEKPITQIHGQIFDFQGIPVLGTYSAEVLLKDESLKRTAWNDLKTFRENLKNIDPDYEKNYREYKLKALQNGMRNGQ